MAPSASCGEQAEELTATALEALSLVEHVPLHQNPVQPTSPVTHLEHLPANIPLPPTSNPRADHAQRLLRSIMSTFHTAHHENDFPLLIRSVTAVNALALASTAYRRLLAHLGIIRLLPPAFACFTAAGNSAALQIIQCLASCLKGADGLAVAHFAASKATRHLLAGWRSLPPAARPRRILTALCDCFAECLPSLPPTALDLLAAPDVLALLHDALESAIAAGDARLAAASLAVLTGVVVHTTDVVDPDTGSTLSQCGPTFLPPVRRCVVQARVREIGFLHSALLALRDLRRHPVVALAALKFLSAAVQDNVQNVVELAGVREALALQLVLRCAGEMASSTGFQMGVSEGAQVTGQPDERTVEILCTICDLVCEICVVKVNFETLLTYGLTGNIVELLGKVLPSVSHVKKGLELLDKSVRSSVVEGKKAFMECAAASVISCMNAYRHNAAVQDIAVRVLISLIEMHEENRGAVCSVHAVQAVHFAMTEHSKDGNVIGMCCELLLLLSPLNIVTSNLQLGELKKLLKSRLKMHKDAHEVTIAIEDLSSALDLVPLKIRKGAEDNFGSATAEHNGVCHSAGVPSKRLLSSRTSGPSSFRKSFHRKARQNRPQGVDANRRRRARSDFTVDTNFATTILRNVEPSLRDPVQSNRMSSRFGEKSYVSSYDIGMSEANVYSNGSCQTNDRKVSDPLIETLSRHKAYQDEASSSHSSQSSRLLSARIRLPNESRLALPILKASGKLPVPGDKREMRSSREWSGSLRFSRKENRTPQSGMDIVEKRLGPGGFSRRRPESLNESRLEMELNMADDKLDSVVVADRDSLLSLSDSEFDSSSEESWGHDNDFANIYGSRTAQHRDQGRYEPDAVQRSSDEFEGPTLLGELDGNMEVLSPIVNILRSLSMANGDSLTQDFDPVDDLQDADEGNTNSTGSHHVSMLTESFSNGNGFHAIDEEPGPQFPKFGERERVRTDIARNSGSWGPPKESIWPLIPIDNAAEVHRNSPVPRMPARGESGSLAYNGVRPQSGPL